MTKRLATCRRLLADGADDLAAELALDEAQGGVLAVQPGVRGRCGVRVLRGCFVPGREALVRRRRSSRSRLLRRGRSVGPGIPYDAGDVDGNPERGRERVFEHIA